MVVSKVLMVFRRCQLSMAPLGVASLSVFFATSLASAETVSIGENDRSLPAVVDVGLPLPAASPFVVSANGGYGRMGPVEDISGNRLQGGFGLAYAVAPSFLIGLDVMGRLDMYPEGGLNGDGDTNAFGQPRINLRYSQPANEKLHWGVQADVRFIGGEAPDVAFNATSPSVRALLGYQLGEGTWLASELGFHLNLSANAVEPDENGLGVTSISDKLTLGASSWNGLPWGIGVTHQLGGAAPNSAGSTQLLGELNGEVLLGGPGFAQSPLGISLGARHHFTPSLLIMAHADVSFSAAPDIEIDEFAPVDPRFRLGAALVYRFGMGSGEPVDPVVEEKPPEEKPEEKPKEDVPAPVKTSSVTGSIVDEGGRPLSDVKVTLIREGAEPIEERSYADGRYEFKEVPEEGAIEVVIETPGYDDVRLTFKEGEERKKEVVLYPSLPAGQVKGQVLDMKGNPVTAKITITPGNKLVEVKPDGSFDLELAPGTYTVRFEHPDHQSQRRVVRVQDRGVVILNIGLLSTKK